MNNSEGSFVIKNKIFKFFFSDMKCSNTEILKNCPENLHPDRPLPYHKYRNTNVNLNFFLCRKSLAITLIKLKFDVCFQTILILSYGHN